MLAALDPHDDRVQLMEHVWAPASPTAPVALRTAVQRARDGRADWFALGRRHRSDDTSLGDAHGTSGPCELTRQFRIRALQKRTGTALRWLAGGAEQRTEEMR